MTIRERTCRYMYQKGTFSKTQCQLCMRMARENCQLLREINTQEYPEDSNNVRELHPAVEGFRPDNHR